jgi:hypothetical protein
MCPSNIKHLKFSKVENTKSVVDPFFQAQFFITKNMFKRSEDISVCKIKQYRPQFKKLATINLKSPKNCLCENSQ